VNPILTDAAVKAALESEVKAHCKSAGHKRLFSGSKEKTRKSEELFAEMSDVKRKMTVNAFVLNVLTLTPCPEHPRNGYIALSVIQEPSTSVPD
jgi:F0F1-type ATP synthase beta subunit